TKPVPRKQLAHLAGREYSSNWLTQATDDQCEKEEHQGRLVVRNDQSTTWSGALFNNTQGCFNLILSEVHHNALPKPIRWKFRIVARGFQRERQTVVPKIHGHKMDITGLSRKWRNALQLLLLGVGVVHFENERCRKLAHSPSPPVQAGA